MKLLHVFFTVWFCDVVICQKNIIPISSFEDGSTYSNEYDKNRYENEKNEYYLYNSNSTEFDGYILNIHKDKDSYFFNNNKVEKDSSNFKAMSIIFQFGHTKSLGKVTTDFSKINMPNSNSPKLDSTYSSSPLFSYRFGTNYNLAINKKNFFNIGLNYAQFSSNIVILNSADVNINNSKIVRRDFTFKNLFFSIGANFMFNKTIFNFTRYLNLYKESKMINSFSDESKEIINLQPVNISNYELSILTPLLKNEKLYLVTTIQNRYTIRYDALFFSPLNMISFSRSYTASIGLSYHFL